MSPNSLLIWHEKTSVVVVQSLFYFWVISSCINMNTFLGGVIKGTQVELPSDIHQYKHALVILQLLTFFYFSGASFFEN